MPSESYCAVLVLMMVGLAGTSAGAQTLAGGATAIDGDNILISGEQVRLWAVDAPEPEQVSRQGAQNFRCGAEAARWLGEFLSGKDITCEVKTNERQAPQRRGLHHGRGKMWGGSLSVPAGHSLSADMASII